MNDLLLNKFKILDGLTIVLTGFISLKLTGGQFDHSERMMWYQLIIISGFLFVAYDGRIYKSWRALDRLDLYKSITLRWLALCLLNFLIIIALDLVSVGANQFFPMWLITCLVCLIAVRVCIYTILGKIRKLGFNKKEVILLGEGDAAALLLQRRKKIEASGFGLSIYRFDDYQRIFERLNLRAVDEIWICASLAKIANIKSLIERLEHYPVSIRIAPDFSDFTLINSGYSAVCGIGMIDICCSGLTSTSRVTKRIFDVVFSLLAMVVLAPVFLVVGLAIKLNSKGPVFFMQIREGLNGKPIKVYKFRSMYLHEDAEARQATKGDDRITPVGKIIRRTSLDEIPQFINVLNGDMSVVGPRPHPIPLNDKFKDSIPMYMRRHLVKPGITGLAQVNGYRGETNTIEKMSMRIEYDLRYIRKWTFFLDIKIILITLYKGIFTENAY